MAWTLEIIGTNDSHNSPCSEVKAEASWHSKSAVYGHTRDGRRNYVHFVTAHDILFIVNNKYYAMKLQEKSESF